jgi:glucan-binding YG repeat protein
MENKIDQFFKDKLEGHVLPPSEEAWAKVEATLSKKNNIAVWRIAAAMLLTGALITVIIWSQQPADKNQRAIAANPSSKDSAIRKKETPQGSSVDKKASVKSLPKKLFITPVTPPVIPHEEKANKSFTPAEPRHVDNNFLPKEEAVSVTDQNISNTKSSEAKAEEITTQEATPSTTIASTHQKSIKLEFTLDDFPSSPSVATVGEVKTTGLKKVWELAREVKNGDGPVREMKNELFALNFKKNKNQ